MFKNPYKRQKSLNENQQTPWYPAAIGAAYPHRCRAFPELLFPELLFPALIIPSATGLFYLFNQKWYSFSKEFIQII